MNKNNFHTAYKSLFSWQNCSKKTFRLNNSWFDPQTVRKGEGGRGKRWPAATFVSFLPHLHPRRCSWAWAQRYQLPQTAKGSESLSAVKIPGIQMGDLSPDPDSSRIKQFQVRKSLRHETNPSLSGNAIKHILKIQDGCNCPSWTKMHSWTQAFLVLEKPWKCKSYSCNGSKSS